MINISKNLRRLRVDASLTQEELASAISVTRQTVSSWETGRTQPDLDMLVSLASALGVDTEEIIYGRKNKVGLEGTKKDRNVFIIVLTVMGSLMTVAGLIMIFAAVWDKLGSIKNVFALIPLLCGFAFTCFVKIKGKTSIPFTEGAGTGWIAGFVASGLLICSQLSVNLETADILVLGIIGTVPVVLITQSVVPFGFYLYLISHLGIHFMTESSMGGVLLSGAVFAALLAAGIIYYLRIYKPADFRRKILFLMLLAAGCTGFCVFAFSVSFCINDDFNEFFAALMFASAVSAHLLFLKDKIAAVKTEKPAFVLLTLSGMIYPFAFDDSTFYSEGTAAYVFFFGIFAVAFLAAFFSSRDKKSVIDIVSAGLCALQGIMVMIWSVSGIDSDRFVPASLIAAVAISLLVTVSGIKTESLARANYGMVSGCALVWCVLISQDYNPAIMGLGIAATGICLLLINRSLIKKMKKEEGAEEAK